MVDDIKSAVEALKKGGTILYPTETVWGIGCDATNNDAVDKLYKLKNKKENEAMLVLVSDIDMIYRFVSKVPEIAIQLIEVSDKPLTIIFPQGCGLSPRITAADGSVGIRIVKHDFCARLIKALKHPLVSTSANISEETTPRSFSEISNKIINGVDHVVDAKWAGKMSGKPSSIIKVGLSSEIKIIRE